MADTTSPEHGSDHDVPAVASLLVPDDTSQDTLAEIFDALDQADFGITHRDGFDAQGTVAYDVIHREPRGAVVSHDATPKANYEEAYVHARNEILAGPAYDVAIEVLGTRIGAAVQFLIDALVADPEFDDPDRAAVLDAMKTAEEQVTTAMLDIAWDRVETER